ncbi:hypothetical protein MLD38_001760 [Melastoma candidum]|uniref:Uncharacterized protein n=1 Tax=Melastoma candidum TaxID=119954 RepID=A0ACB9SEP5_9MYRT|nr:hypothetical protein MLD38_001760 [Melastoma candidum]
MSKGLAVGLRKMRAVAVAASKVSLIKVSMAFFVLFFIRYAALMLCPPSSVDKSYGASVIRCSMHECLHKGDDGVENKKKAVLEVMDRNRYAWLLLKGGKNIRMPSFLKDVLQPTTTAKIGVINMDEDDVSKWSRFGDTIPIRFDRLSEQLKWKDLFPEWIDEEEKSDVSRCPDIPMPDFEEYPDMDLIVAKVPCNYPEEGWNRDLFRLQVHLVTARMAVEKGKKYHSGGLSRGTTKVVVLSKCRPMPDILRCDDLARKDDDWWYYEVDVALLQQKVSLPVGSCQLSLPLWSQGM